MRPSTGRPLSWTREAVGEVAASQDGLGDGEHGEGLSQADGGGQAAEPEGLGGEDPQPVRGRGQGEVDGAGAVLAGGHDGEDDLARCRPWYHSPSAVGSNRARWAAVMTS